MALQRYHGLVLAGILEVPREGALTLNLGAGMAPICLAMNCWDDGCLQGLCTGGNGQAGHMQDS